MPGTKQYERRAAMTEYTQAAEDPTVRLRSAEQDSADLADLQASLADLAGLVTSSLGLEELLGQVATFAARAIPGADGAGVTLLRVDRPVNRIETSAASAPFPPISPSARRARC